MADEKPKDAEPKSAKTAAPATDAKDVEKAPDEPTTPAKEWTAAVVLMALFALAFAALMSMFRP